MRLNDWKRQAEEYRDVDRAAQAAAEAEIEKERTMHPQNQHTYAQHLREEVRDLESSDPDCLRKLLNLLDNALGELDRQGQLLDSRSPSAPLDAAKPWRVAFNKEAKLCPWNVIGPEGVECGCQSEKDAKREANKWNRVYAMGAAAARSPLRRGTYEEGLEMGRFLRLLDCSRARRCAE